MDPDKNLIYTRRKVRQEQLAQSVAMPEESTGKKSGKSGKDFDRNKQNHAVPTSIKKAKTFLDDEYVRDLTCASDDQYFYLKCLCYHSFKKMSHPTNYKLHFV